MFKELHMSLNENTKYNNSILARMCADFILLLLKTAKPIINRVVAVKS